jgi:predicted nucleic acid-binding protein
LNAPAPRAPRWVAPELADRPRGVLVDTNVIIDLAQEDAVWSEWSAQAIGYLGDRLALAINPIILAEVAAVYATPEELDAALPPAIYRRDPLPWEAAFLAGRAFVAYRRRGGMRRSPLPDFYIGAHAAVTGMLLLTRDASRYRTYFPTLRIVAPEP